LRCAPSGLHMRQYLSQRLPRFLAVTIQELESITTPFYSGP